MDGKAVAAKVRAEVAIRAREFAAKYGRRPGLAVVQVGQDAASTVYVRNKRKSSVEAEIESFAHDLPATTSQADLLDLVHELNRDPHVDGILVQMPLPKGLDSDLIMDAVDPAKDVDGFHPTNTGLLAQKRPQLRPCTPFGVIRLAKEYGIDLTGLRATVVGASNIVGRPMALSCSSLAPRSLCVIRVPRISSLKFLGLTSWSPLSVKLDLFRVTGSSRGRRSSMWASTVLPRASWWATLNMTKPRSVPAGSRPSPVGWGR